MFLGSERRCLLVSDASQSSIYDSSIASLPGSYAFPSIERNTGIITIEL